MSTRTKSIHQQRVERAMILGGQHIPAAPTTDVPAATIILRAKLIVEECLEKLAALGVQVMMRKNHTNYDLVNDFDASSIMVHFSVVKPVDLVALADACADVSVVNTGTLSAFGIVDSSLLELIDASNLAKFDPPTCPECNRPMRCERLEGEPRWVCPEDYHHGGHRGLPLKEGPWVRADGKYMKPPYWKPPAVGPLLESQRMEVLDAAANNEGRGGTAADDGPGGVAQG